MRDDFAVIIPTYGRAGRVYTIHSLRRQGYTGPIYLLCDDEDVQLEEYKSLHPGRVLVFSKKDYEGKFDKMDNFGRRNVVVYARNAIYDAAKSVGLRYIAVMDDDYRGFSYRVDKNYEYISSRRIRSLDKVFDACINFLISSGVKTICSAQGGDFIGGADNYSLAIKKEPKRKAMNLFFFDVENPMEFMGTINEDLTASIAEGIAGNVVLTTPLFSLEQHKTQTNAGGLTDIYLDLGTYVKSFYSVMYAPSAVKVSTLRGQRYVRFHHQVDWNACVPKILRETV